MELNQVPPASTPPAEGRQPISRVAATALTLGFVVASLTAFYISFLMSLCTLFGETCSEAEESRINVLTGMGLLFGIGGPFLVAWLRRAAVWALTPLIIAAAVIIGWQIDQIFDL